MSDEKIMRKQEEMIRSLQRINKDVRDKLRAYTERWLAALAKIELLEDKDGAYGGSATFAAEFAFYRAMRLGQISRAESRCTDNRRIARIVEAMRCSENDARKDAEASASA